MLGVEAGVVAAEGVRGGIAFRVKKGCGGQALSVPLLPAFANADGFGAVGILPGAQFGVHQPEGLPKEAQQQQSGEKLGAAEALAGEIWTHKVEPSVLPCRRRFA